MVYVGLISHGPRCCRYMRSEKLLSALLVQIPNAASVYRLHHNFCRRSRHHVELIAVSAESVQQPTRKLNKIKILQHFLQQTCVHTEMINSAK